METLKCEERNKNSAHSARRERKHGKIPGVLYGSKIRNFLFEVGEMELNKQIKSQGEHGAIDIEVNNENHKALIKEIQKDPLTQKIIHIDLQDIDNNKVIQTEIPLVFEGEEFVSKHGGIIQKEKNNVKVQGTCDNIPKVLNVNVSNMYPGNVFRVCDLELGEDISFVDDVNTVLAVVSRGGTITDSEDDSNLNENIENDIESN